MFLIGRSPVFEAMFEHDTKEAQSGRVEISDISVEAFDRMLKYIYTGKVDQIEEWAVQLLIAADKVKSILHFFVFFCFCVSNKVFSFPKKVCTQRIEIRMRTVDKKTSDSR